MKTTHNHTQIKLKYLKQNMKKISLNIGNSNAIPASNIMVKLDTTLNTPSILSFDAKLTKI